jgi:hypothetical protein
MLVALGLLMAADQLDRMSISRTWPVLLILFGLFKLAEHLGSKEAAPPDLNQHDQGTRNL